LTTLSIGVGGNGRTEPSLGVAAKAGVRLQKAASRVSFAFMAALRLLEILAGCRPDGGVESEQCDRLGKSAMRRLGLDFPNAVVGD
jgi:hypothetical protein